MPRNKHLKSMADIVAEVEEDDLHSVDRPSDRYDAHINGRLFNRSDDTLTPEQARDLAASSHLVIWDSCGCGSYCDAYQIWQGSGIDALLNAGLPKLKHGSARMIEDDAGNRGLLLEQAVRWGPLR